jgi:hypothetical protein
MNWCCCSLSVLGTLICFAGIGCGGSPPSQARKSVFEGAYSMPEASRKKLLEAIVGANKGDTEASFVNSAGSPTLRKELWPKMPNATLSGTSLFYAIEWKNSNLVGTQGDLLVEVFCDAQGEIDYMVTNWPPAIESGAHLLGP